MWPFKKEPRPYTHPTGRHARPGWQIVLAAWRHTITGWGIGFATFYTLGFILLGFVVRDNFWDAVLFWPTMVWYILTANGPNKAPVLPILMAAFALLLLVVSFSQLVHAKRQGIPHAIPKILRYTMIACFVMAVFCSLMWIRFSWFGAFWEFAVVLLSLGIPPLIVSVGRLRISIIFGFVFSYAAIIVFGINLGEEVFDTPTPGLIAGVIALLFAGIGVWWGAYYRLRYCWTPSDEDLFLTMQWSAPAPILQRKFLRNKKEDWFANWFTKEREQRFEKLCDHSPRTFREQIRFFRIVSRPPRILLPTILLLVVLIPILAMISGEFGVSACLGGLIALVILITQFGIMIQEWRQNFASEMLLPISRKRLLWGISLSRLQNIFLGAAPFLILMPIFIGIATSPSYLFENLAVLALFYVMLFTVIPSLTLMAVYLPIYAFVGCFLAIEFFFGIYIFATLPKEAHFAIGDMIILTLVGAVMLPIGLWRLYRIEPDRVGKR